MWPSNQTKGRVVVVNHFGNDMFYTRFNRNNQILFLDSSTFDFLLCFFRLRRMHVTTHTTRNPIPVVLFRNQQGGQRLPTDLPAAIGRPDGNPSSKVLLDNRVDSDDWVVQVDIVMSSGPI